MNAGRHEGYQRVSDEHPIPGLFRSHNHSLVDYASGIVGNRAQAEDVVQEA